ncbi:PTS-dependent dihydroxyacetone kinase phosphotransferase subunit DhaM [Leifsonia shinshuensis]|uniref:dihydroxyacetone kinase phosphoryl donor subunit DhaM n=1 Tax=Leifsonia shinshuensis TaxID=150026 RepID=UPI001F5075D2|nr:dihydroxyacetone kinase phosphoryl donor subunit DhaM [Leifsonia shinshuensis]MCI0155835.1 PTS-dependent dihydroxyacetone kinase phosphotransferase subunit DhaM [Leifsonia shinshuensis]
MSGTVGIVFVSHSSQLAAGVVALAGQMAPSVPLLAAGGTDDDGIGTSFGKVMTAVGEADQGAGVVVVSDLGSALLTAETVLDLLPDDERARVRVVDGPFVEGGVAAAVAAETGADLEGVAAAVEGARSAWGGAEQSPAPEADPGTPTAEPRDDGGRRGDSGYEREVLVRNPQGLHARPAAEFVKLANTFPVKVTVNGKDAKSLLGVMSLGLTAGSTASIASPDDEGEAAVDALVELVESGFGEV